MKVTVDSEVYDVLGEVRFAFVMAQVDDVQASSGELVLSIEQAAGVLATKKDGYSQVFSDYCEAQGLSQRHVWSPLKQAKLIAASGYRTHGKVIDAYMLAEMRTGISIHAFDLEGLDNLRLGISKDVYSVKNVSARKREVHKGEWTLKADGSLVMAASVGVTYPYRITDRTKKVCYRLMKLAGQSEELFDEAQSLLVGRLASFELFQT